MKAKKNNPERWSRIQPHAQPIFQTSVYDYPDLESLDDYYNGLIPGGYIYSRNGLPNSTELGKKFASFEKAESGLVCSSGMSAILVATLAFLGNGDAVTASNELYGGTSVLLRDELSRLGIKTNFVDASSKFEIPANTKVVLVETISNPTMKVCDIKSIAKLARDRGAMLVVDNTFATPFVVRPSELGADVVMHSGTKFLGGHGDLTIGLLCGCAKEMKRAAQFNTRIGAIAGPFDCWLATRSLGTWELRVKQSCASAMKLARFLEDNKDKVSKVCYPGLESHPQHKLAMKTFENGMFGGMVSFDLRGGLDSASSFVKSLGMVTLTPSLGGVQTTISHPGKTSHRYISKEQKAESGITDAMIRVSVGVEDYPLIESDFEIALAGA
ncbi:MAG: trans-sulfuration enzyme family protein [Nitrososphaerales archaeon]